MEELIRITNSGGLIYIDHEVNDNRWHIGHELKEYYDFTKKTFLRNTFTLIRSGQLFSPGFIKSFFVKRFVNKRYKREGDIHVWPDDHIEWDKIISVLEESCKIILQEDYLLYNPLVDFSIYKHYQKNATI